MRRVLGAALLMSTFLAGSSHASPVDWADWTDASVSGAALTGATGNVGGVSLGFTGTLRFAQLASGSMVGTGASATTDYWTEASPAPYTGNAVVDNRPPGFELLAFDAASTNRLVFGSPVTDPLMAIVSQGRPTLTVTYDFDTPFTLLSEGRGFWGDGTFTTGPGDVLNGNELHAVIQFSGTLSEINWTSTAEFWHGFTIGLVRVPEPASLALVGLGLVGLGYAGRRKR